MPTPRRPYAAQARKLNPLEVLNYAVASPGDPRVRDRELYAANRQQLLAKGLLTHSEAFWLHEEGIPPELRPGADDDLEAEWLDEYGEYPASERQREARRLWLTVAKPGGSVAMQTVDHEGSVPLVASMRPAPEPRTVGVKS